jgi:hypothetical protein
MSRSCAFCLLYARITAGLVFLSVLMLLNACDARSQTLYVWQVDGVAVCTDPATQDQPNIISDSRGGAFVVWRDNRSGDHDVYGMRLYAGGHAWSQGEIEICVESGDQGCNTTADDPIPLVQDQGAGFFVTWEDLRSGSPLVYAQHIRQDGSLSFPAGGTDLFPYACYGGTVYDYPVLVGGMYEGEAIAVSHRRCGRCGIGYQLDNGIKCQKLNSTTGLDWNDASMAFMLTCCDARGTSWGFPEACSDGQGGVIAVWSDVYGDVYANRVNSTGVLQWGSLGCWTSPRVCGASGAQSNPVIVANGAGGAIVCWEDNRSGVKEIYAQWIYADGVFRWDANGKVIASSAGNLTRPAMCSDGLGGTYITWQDESSPGNKDVYMHHVTINGDTTCSRIPVCTADYNQGDPQIVGDGSGGAYIVWWDERDGFKDIYAQHVASGDTLVWDDEGYPVCTAGYDQDHPQAVLDTYQNALLVAWVDWRSGNPDIYAQWVNDEGATGVVGPGLDMAGIVVCPNPSGAGVTVRLALGRIICVSMRVVSVEGRVIAHPHEQTLSAGYHELRWDGRDDQGNRVPSGVYMLMISADGACRHTKVVLLR